MTSLSSPLREVRDGDQLFPTLEPHAPDLLSRAPVDAADANRFLESHLLCGRPSWVTKSYLPGLTSFRYQPLGLFPVMGGGTVNPSPSHLAQSLEAINSFVPGESSDHTAGLFQEIHVLRVAVCPLIKLAESEQEQYGRPRITECFKVKIKLRSSEVECFRNPSLSKYTSVVSREVGFFLRTLPLLRALPQM